MPSPSRLRQPFVILGLAFAAYTTTLWSQTRPAAPPPQTGPGTGRGRARRAAAIGQGSGARRGAADQRHLSADRRQGGHGFRNGTTSTPSCLDGWRRTAFRMPACRRTKSSCAASTSTSSACRRAPTRSARSSTTRSADKRDRLIDALMARDEFAEQWAWYWGDLLRMSNEAGPGANAFHYWFKEQLRVDRPYDQLVHDVLTPSAKVARDPPVARHHRPQQPAEEPVRRERRRLPHLEPPRSHRRAHRRRQPRVPRPQHLVHLLPRRRAPPRGDQPLPGRPHAQGVLRHGRVLRQDAAHRQLERQVAQRRSRSPGGRSRQGLRRRRRCAVPDAGGEPVPSTEEARTSRRSC